MQETGVWSLDWEASLEKGMATHSSILAWRSPWTEKPGELQPMGSQRVRHNWVTSTFTFSYNYWHSGCIYNSVQFSCSVMSNSLQPYWLQHARLLCPSPTPRACSDSCPLSQWCHPTISSSVIPFSSCLQSCPVTRSFLMSQFFTSGGQMMGASKSALPMNIQDFFTLGLTGLISLQSKGLSNNTV